MPKNIFDLVIIDHIRKRIDVGPQPDVFLEVFKAVNVGPLSVQVGTEVQVLNSTPGEPEFVYKPNYILKVKEDVFNGEFSFIADQQAVNYKKDVFVRGARVEINGAASVTDPWPVLSLNCMVGTGVTAQPKKNSLEYNAKFFKDGDELDEWGLGALPLQSLEIEAQGSMTLPRKVETTMYRDFPAINTDQPMKLDFQTLKISAVL